MKLEASAVFIINSTRPDNVAYCAALENIARTLETIDLKFHGRPRLSVPISMTARCDSVTDEQINFVRRNEGRWVWGQSRTIEFRADWDDEDEISQTLLEITKRNKDANIRHVGTQFSGALNEYAQKYIIALSLYLPDVFSSLVCISSSSNREDKTSFGCNAWLEEPVKVLIEADVNPYPAISLQDFLRWMGSISGFW